jgi:hypothetical protein
MKLSTHRLAAIFLSALMLAVGSHSYGIDKTHYQELFQKLGALKPGGEVHAAGAAAVCRARSAALKKLTR